MTHLLWLNLLLFWELSPLRVIKEIVDAWGSNRFITKEFAKYNHLLRLLLEYGNLSKD